MKSELVYLYQPLDGPNFLFSPRKSGDVGYDLPVYIEKSNQTIIDRIVSFFLFKKSIIIWPIIGVRTINSGIYLIMPDHLWAEIRPRSSTSRKKLNILGGTIDSGYHGEMFTVIHNLGFIPRIISHDQRYSQVVFRYAIRPQMRLIGDESFHHMVNESIKDGGRGLTGFGSTGS